ALSRTAFAWRTWASSDRISYRSKSKWTSRSSPTATNSFGLGRSGLPGARPAAAAPPMDPPAARSPPMDPGDPGAEVSDVPAHLAQPARTGTDVSSNTRTIREQRSIIAPPFRKPRGVGHESVPRPGRSASAAHPMPDRKSTRLNSSHQIISYAVFCLKKKILRSAHTAFQAEAL